MLLQIKTQIIIFSMLFLLVASIHGQTEAPSWVDFAQKKESNNLSEAVLNDYSYSGYHFSEKEIPNVSTWNTINVLDYGAIADDTGYDDVGIQAAIDAAIASGQQTVVFFPAGRYKVASSSTENTPIIISGSNIVLKGAGMGTGGTEIYTDKFGDKPWRFRFQPLDVSSTEITNVTTEIKKGDFKIEVTNASTLIVGQTVDVFQIAVANLEANMSGLPYKDVWKIKNNGIRPYEKHLITAISGNEVTFKNPFQLNMPAHSSTVLRTHNTIEEVGVEDILFTSGWKDYPEDYKHHANDIVDYAWRALVFENVKNGWIKNCHFKDWNEVLQIEKSIGITVKDIEISGKKGHTSYFARYSYGILFENCVDNVTEGLSLDDVPGMGHGPGMRWSTTSTVFLNCGMQKHQSIDCHGYHPYGNLLDNVYGGTIRNNGGAENSYPNSGPYMSFWNFKHWARYSNKTFDFWDNINRKTHTYAKPIFVGFQTTESRENITFVNEELDELNGEQVYPESLFDAQLQLRLYGAYMSASSSKNDFPAKHANDNKIETNWETQNSGIGEWIMMDLGTSQDVSSIELNEISNRIGNWKLEYWDGTTWLSLKTGNAIGSEKTISFNEVNTRKIRFTIISMLSGQESTSALLSNFQLASSLSIDAVNKFKNGIKIYPNPNSGLFELDLLNTDKDVELKIYNIHAQLITSKIYKNTSSKFQVDITDKPSGIYFIRVNMDNPVFIKIVKK